MMQRGPPFVRYLPPIITLIGLYIFSSSFFLAKRSLPRTSTCQDAESLLRDTLGLDPQLVKSLSEGTLYSDCWMKPSVDKLVVLVVDALRFDFAEQSLPHSFGRRVAQKDAILLQFIADPPTVTMQRLKGLTTGGLPTFAEISGNLGGGYVEEDSWVDFLYKGGKNMGFVGDDTWIDLFPHQWKEAHPFPSFNTRDLDTVDNGCLEYLPPLLDDLEKGELDVVVAHFLGVDHVGHTYGPHTEHMEQKLAQMDEVLDVTLSQLESSKNCILTLVFGDHGMTEDGNHGGGTPEEVRAALFVHASDACPAMQGSVTELSQIDMVPTVSLALGIPIPYSNLGGLVPSLLPGVADENATLALALNAGQVWRYLTEYSSKANRLPLKDLEVLLKDAVSAYQQALATKDATTFATASLHFKGFLNEATELGKRVWTRFDGTGMLVGGVIVGLMLIHLLFNLVNVAAATRRRPKLEEVLTIIFAIFTCGLLTFSNSYINGEQSISAFALSILCIAIAVRLSIKRRNSLEPLLPLVIPIAARCHELVVTGHGLDPSILLHTAHRPLTFLVSLVLLAYLYLRLVRKEPQVCRELATHSYMDLVTLISTALSWWEKRQPEVEHNGYVFCRMALVLWAISLLYGIYTVLVRRKGGRILVAIKVGIGIMIVTGPSAAASMILFWIQAWALQRLQGQEVAPPVQAILWRLTIRHAFFATNHACSFNRLHLSAAFIATEEFVHATAGMSLFMNTFGWEFLGLLLVSEWRWYTFYQLLETTISFISVSLMRRHLMVWAIFAPRFLFAAVFLILHSLGHIVRLAVTE